MSLPRIHFHYLLLLLFLFNHRIFFHDDLATYLLVLSLSISINEHEASLAATTTSKTQPRFTTHCRMIRVCPRARKIFHFIQIFVMCAQQGHLVSFLSASQPMLLPHTHTFAPFEYRYNVFSNIFTSSSLEYRILVDYIGKYLI